MMNSIQVYSNKNFSVRTTQGVDGTVWFVAKDIAEALEYSEASNPARLFANVPDFWKGVKPFHIRSENGVVQEREVLCLTEQGLYFFLGRSDKKKALPYQMWIAGDVVPSIRKTGSYTVNEKMPPISKQELESAAFFYEYAGINGNQAVLALDKFYRIRG